MFSWITSYTHLLPYTLLTLHITSLHISEPFAILGFASTVYSKLWLITKVKNMLFQIKNSCLFANLRTHICRQKDYFKVKRN